MMSKFQLLGRISPSSLDALIATLCDGDTLKKLGITDEDTSAVEDLYDWALVPEEELSDFAVTCYDGNSTDELIEALITGETDMKDWDLPSPKWMIDVETSLREKLRLFN